jgi:hypothetical protein
MFDTCATLVAVEEDYMVAELAAAVRDQIDTCFDAWDQLTGKNPLPGTNEQNETTLLAREAGSEDEDFPYPALDQKTQDWWR